MFSIRTSQWSSGSMSDPVSEVPGSSLTVEYVYHKSQCVIQPWAAHRYFCA